MLTIAAVRPRRSEWQLSALDVDGHERPLPAIHRTYRRCITAFPKRTLIHRRSILPCWITAMRDKTVLRFARANVWFGEAINKRSFWGGL